MVSDWLVQHSVAEAMQAAAMDPALTASQRHVRFVCLCVCVCMYGSTGTTAIGMVPVPGTANDFLTDLIPLLPSIRKQYAYRY